MQNARTITFGLAAGLVAVLGSGDQASAQTALPTNLPGVTSTAAPPAAFNPLTASREALDLYGFPPRPDPLAAPLSYAHWQRAMQASANRIVPALEMTDLQAGPGHPGPRTARPATGSTGTSTNWSGSVAFSGASSYGNTSFSYVLADYVIPVASQAYGTCTGGWDYVVTWVGIDGWNSGDVLQAGNEADAYCSGSSRSTYYSAWYEWYPNNWTRISNLPIQPGDDLYVEVWNTSATSGHAYFVNLNTNVSTTINFSAPSGTVLVGNSAEWIVEDPTEGGSLATLANYAQDYFSGGTAATFSKTSYHPGVSSDLFVTMVNGSGTALSAPTALGSNALLLTVEGPAK